MYFCYVDESGDAGKYDPENAGKSGSPYFILTGMIVEADKWKASLDVIKSFRKHLAAKAYLPYEVEFHCSEIIDPHKIAVLRQISIPDRWGLISGFAETIGRRIPCAIIAVVVKKATCRLITGDYNLDAIVTLYQAFDEFLKMHMAYGSVLFDRTSEKSVTTYIRGLMGTGPGNRSFPDIHIGRIIEDPIFRESSHSFFIQAADVIAYTLKEKEFPIASRKKFSADRIFQNMLIDRCIRCSLTGEDGIIRI